MLKRYLKSSSGNMAITGAISISVMLLAIGAAIDITSTSSQQKSLQDMVDNATLAAARSKERNTKKLQIIVDKVIEQHNVEGWPIKATLKLKDDTVFVEAASSYDTWLMGMMGKDRLPINVDAAAPLAIDIPINLSLVLDTTASMTGNNIKDLKSASNAMVEEFETFDADIRLAVVPFGKYVNVGMKNKKAHWIDTSKDGTFNESEFCYDEMITIKERVCTGTGVFETKDHYADGVYQGSSQSEVQNCTPGEYQPTGNRICEMRKHYFNWHGCVGSRQSPHNEKAPYAGRRIPGIMNETCGSEMIPLTNNLKTVKKTIDGLSTSGETYLPSGVIWGWRALQKDVPLTEVSKVKNKDYAQNAMVIMTDGENTLSQGSDERHNGTDVKDANKRTEKLCESAKTDKITIFTVGYRMGSGRAEMEKLLKNCATQQNYYYDAKDANELKKAFKDIANNLYSTRLTH
jgi:Flp pilus assembly protein TadG